MIYLHKECWLQWNCQAWIFGFSHFSSFTDDWNHSNTPFNRCLLQWTYRTDW
jgi:hypothetical protein